MYKVVTNIDGKLHSAFVYDVDGIDIKYEVNKWIRPNIEGTRIFVFVDLDDARQFIRNIQHKLFRGQRFEIYNCSVLNPVYHYNKFVKSFTDLRYLVSCNKYNPKLLVEKLQEFDDVPIWKSIYAEAIKLHDLIEYHNNCYENSR